MGGDRPMDMRDDLLGRYDKPEEDTYYFELEQPVLNSYIQRDLDILITKAVEASDDHALPFVVVDYGIRCTPEQAAIIKDLIKDGGGGERGYTQKRVGTLRNKWNGLKCPQDYCDQLRYYFDDIVSGRIDKSVLGEFLGLLDTIATKCAKQPRSVNVD